MDRFREAFTSLSIHALHLWHQSILVCATSSLTGLWSFSPHAEHIEEEPLVSDFVS